MTLALFGLPTWQLGLIVGLIILIVVLLILKKRQQV